MKYRYSRMAIVLQALLIIGILALAIFLCYMSNEDIKYLKKMLVIIPCYLITGYFLWSKEYFNRFAEFHDEYITFNSFRISKKVRDFNVRYEDILSLDAVIIPLLGIYKIKVKCKNIPWQIPVTWCMCNHNELFAKLCLEAESHNPNAYIDPRVIEFLEKRGIYE